MLAEAKQNYARLEVKATAKRLATDRGHAGKVILVLQKITTSTSS